MIKKAAAIFLFFPSFFCYSQENSALEFLQNALNTKKDSLEILYNSSYFGVPESPAFALLPDKPGEISNLVSPKDFISFVPTTISDGKIKTGIGADVRPFSQNVGDIKTYWDKPLKRIMWRTIASVGTSPLEDSEDSYLALGIRIPIIDKGDPRNHRSRVLAIENQINDIMEKEGPPPFEPDSIWFAKRNKKIDSLTNSKWKEFKNENWNAFKLNVGIGNAWLLSSSSIKSDSISQNRLGAWIAASKQLTKNDQLIVSANRSFIDTQDVDSLERARSVVGLKYRYIFGEKLSLSLETAKVWSDFKDGEGEESEDKSWYHFGALAEIRVPKLGGYFGLGGGINTEDKDARFQFKYALYTDRLEKK